MPKSLTARIGHQDFRFDHMNKILGVAVLNDQWVELESQWYGELDRYFDGSWGLGEICW